MQSNSLTKIKNQTTILLAGQTDAGSAGEQLARDNRLKATNCRWGGSYTPAVPFYEQRQFRALLCLKKPPCRRQEKSLNCEVDLSNLR